MMYAEQILLAYKGRQQAANWATWASLNEYAADLLADAEQCQTT